MKRILFIIFFFISASAFSQQSDKDLQSVSSLINKQQQAWNRSDLEGFMSSYWHSDSLMFIGKNGIKYGWQTTLDNYKKSYPNADAMGQLKFNIIKIEKLSNTSIFVVGKWSVARNEGDLSGHFTLLWKKIKGEWVIVTDHSS